MADFDRLMKAAFDAHLNNNITNTFMWMMRMIQEVHEENLRLRTDLTRLQLQIQAEALRKEYARNDWPENLSMGEYDPDLDTESTDEG